MGEIVGGLLAVIVLAWIVEAIAISKVMDDPRSGGLLSVAVAYLLAAVLYGFGAANGGPWTPRGLLAYLPGAIIWAGYIAWKRKPAETEL